MKDAENASETVRVTPHLKRAKIAAFGLVVAKPNALEIEAQSEQRFKIVS
jgi:hypothetical protein